VTKVKNHFDPEIAFAAPVGTLAQVHEIFRNELKACLLREAFQDASEFHACIMLLLDAMNCAQPIPRGQRSALFQRLGERLETLAGR